VAEARGVGHASARDETLGATGADLRLWTYDEVAVAADLPRGATIGYIGARERFQYAVPPGYSPAED